MLSLDYIGVIFGLVIIFVASRVQKYTHGLRVVSNLPGMRVPLAPLSPLGIIIPTTWWNPGGRWSWLWRKTVYNSYKWDMMSIVPFLFGNPSFYVGSMASMKQLLGCEGKVRLLKNRDFSTPLLHFGENLLTTNDDEWKKQRRLVASTFSPNIYNLVVEHTQSIYEELVVTEGWSDQQEVVVKTFNRITTTFAFTVIARCGFGFQIPWLVDGVDKTEEMSMGEAMKIVSETEILRLILPRWSYLLPIERLRDIEKAWKIMRQSMAQAFDRKKAELAAAEPGSEEKSADIFSRLVAATEDTAKWTITSQEVIGNTYSLLLAGHETTARVLAATISLLAFYQEEQDKVVNEINSIFVDRKPLSPADVQKLSYTLAVFLETLRMFPAGSTIVREAGEDIELETNAHPSGKVTISQGTLVMVDMIAIHHNPYVFNDPDVFRPSRWQDASDQDITMFSVGPRACVGKKFAQIEAVAFLAVFLRDWKVDVVLEAGEKRESFLEKLMASPRLHGLAFGIGSVDIKLIRRNA